MTLTKEQQELRLQGIGASEVAAILGLDEHNTPHNVWLEKTKRVPPFAGNQATKMGHLLEPVAVQLYEERYPNVVTAKSGTIVGAEPWMLATPDRIVRPRVSTERTRLLEIKTRSRFNMGDYGTEGTDQVSMRDRVQVTWQQYVSGITAPASLCVLVDGREFLTYTLPFDEELAGELYWALRDWWFRHVVADKEPEGVAPLAYLSKTLKMTDKETIDATPEHEALLEDLASARRMIDDGKWLKERASAKMAKLLDGVGGVKGEAGSVSFRPRQGQKYVQWKEMVATLAADYEIDEATLRGYFDRFSGRHPMQRVFQFRPAKSDAPIGYEAMLALEAGDNSEGEQ